LYSMHKTFRERKQKIVNGGDYFVAATGSRDSGFRKIYSSL
jgi:hypothetical protein